MTGSNASFPTFPLGLWRRIVLQPGPGWIGAALEDDMHCFSIRLDHDGERITKVIAKAHRTPWSACPGATAFIAKELTGELLAEVARRDPTQHCTHLLDMAIVAAAHAHDTSPTVFDMQVADRVEGRTTATLFQDGAERLHWQLQDTIIEGPERFAGLDIKRVSKWKHDFPLQEAEWSTLLRRAIFISGGRVYQPPMGKRAAEMGPMRMGVCYNYQVPQADKSTPIFDRREFPMTEHEPLEDFDRETAFSAMGEE